MIVDYQLQDGWEVLLLLYLANGEKFLENGMKCKDGRRGGFLI